MAIIKSKHASNYTVLPNDVFKSGLSLDAIGLLSYLLSLPHDWVIYKTQLHNQLGIGRDKLNSAFSKLTNTGYILSVKKQNKFGKIEYEHIVYDKPYNGEPQAENPHTVSPLAANLQLQSTNNTKETITKENNTKYSFVDFWNLYDKKVGDKEKIEKKYNRLTEDVKELIFKHIVMYKKSQPEKQFRKNPETYLNNKSWNDEIVGIIGIHTKPLKNNIEL
jgi:hypothetical protein